MIVLHLLGPLAAFNVVFLLVQVAVLQLLRIGTEEITFGLGPRLLTFPIAGARVNVRVLPITAWVMPHGMRDGDLVGVPSSVVCAVYALPWLVLLAAIAAFVGIELTARWVTSAVPQLASAVYPELGGGVRLLGRYDALFVAQPMLATLALSTKLCVVNLLPLPNLAGGRVLMELLPLSSRAKGAAAALALLLLTFPLLAAWAWSCIRYLL